MHSIIVLQCWVRVQIILYYLCYSYGLLITVYRILFLFRMVGKAGQGGRRPAATASPAAEPHRSSTSSQEQCLHCLWHRRGGLRNLGAGGHPQSGSALLRCRLIVAGLATTSDMSPPAATTVAETVARCWVADMWYLAATWVVTLSSVLRSMPVQGMVSAFLLSAFWVRALGLYSSSMPSGSPASSWPSWSSWSLGRGGEEACAVALRSCSHWRLVPVSFSRRCLRSMRAESLVSMPATDELLVSFSWAL